MTSSYLQYFALFFGVITSIGGGLFMLMPGRNSASRTIMTTFTLQGLMLTVVSAFPETIALGCAL